jgi:hypothetical protein
MARVIAVSENDPEVFLVGTRRATWVIQGRSHDVGYGRIYDRSRDLLSPGDLLVGSITAMTHGRWVEVNPADHADVAEALSPRLS